MQIHASEFDKMDLEYRPLLCPMEGPPGHVDCDFPSQMILHALNACVLYIFQAIPLQCSLGGKDFNCMALVDVCWFGAWHVFVLFMCTQTACPKSAGFGHASLTWLYIGCYLLSQSNQLHFPFIVVLSKDVVTLMEALSAGGLMAIKMERNNAADK